MKRCLLFLLMLDITVQSLAQLKPTVVCGSFMVDLLDGNVNGIRPDFHPDRIKLKLPCFTSAEDESSKAKCGGMISYKDKDIYFFTKTTSGSKVYKLAFPYDATSVYTLTFLGQLSLNSVVGASISYDQKEIIIKTYTGLNYYSKSSSENIFQAVSKPPEIIPYVLEPQGEAVSFAKDNSGYFTLSEKGFGTQVWLYFYKRN